MNRTKPKIIFIDDEPNIVQALKRKIRSEMQAWDTAFYSDSLQAKKALLEKGADVVVTDIRMPGITGLDLLKQVKSSMGDESPQFIIVTGEGDTSLRRKALDLDATDLLNKPVNREDLLARIRNAIRLQQNKKALQLKSKLLETQLIELQKMEIVGMMASGVAHDFNNILTVIMNYLQMIELQFEESSDFVREIEKVRHTAVRGQQLTGQMLKFVRQQKIGMDRINLVQLINEALPILHMALPKGARLIWQTPQAEMVVRGEYGQLFQIVMNLIVNAANQLSDNGEVTLTADRQTIPEPVEFADTVLQPGNYFCITVTDNGPSMLNAFIESFLKNPVQKRESRNGSGLGLSIVSRCVLQHNGFMQVKNNESQGAEFSVFLPRDEGKSIEKSTVC